jgi:hypothetical protein
VSGIWEPPEPVRAEVDGREVEIREKYPDLYNAYDAATGERLTVCVDQGDGWWLGVRIGYQRRQLHAPDGVVEVTRRLLAAP